jgi:plasmid stabilization system protein ParE
LKLDQLFDAVISHRGQFLCEEIHQEKNTKVVEFSHRVAPAVANVGVPNVGRLQDFYDTFSSIVFFVDERSGDAGKHIASPDQWAELDEEFRGWIDHFSEEEREEYLPEWVDTCLVIGEEPRTGNYLLMATSGEDEGKVILFDHDGYEFIEEAKDIIAYVEYMLAPDNQLLVGMASHMRFIEDDQPVQWWIRELRDNRGNEASTAA